MGVQAGVSIHVCMRSLAVLNKTRDSKRRRPHWEQGPHKCEGQAWVLGEDGSEDVRENV